MTAILSDMRQARYKALSEPSRRHLLRVLEDAGAPMPVIDLAARLNLHHNTVRGHLEVLCEAGFVERSTERRTRPGRPRTLYAAIESSPSAPDSESYKFLSEILASLVDAAVDDAAAAATEVGRAWGRYLVERPAPFKEIEPEEVVSLIVSRLTDFGFDPESIPTEKGAVIRLHDCPFREVARTRQDVICSVHLGLMRGMAEEQGGKVSVDRLQPFVEPSLCLASFSYSAG